MRAKFSRLVVQAVRRNVHFFSSRLFSIMALSRGETRGLTPHKKKEEIEQKHS